MAAFLVLLPLLGFISDARSFEVCPLDLTNGPKESEARVSFDLGKASLPLQPSFDEAASQLEWSYDPVRPGRVEEEKRLALRIKGSKELKRVHMPERVFLAFDGMGNLKFEKMNDSFWIDVKEDTFQLGAKFTNGGIIQSNPMPIVLQGLVAGSFTDVDENSPFRTLAGCRFLGTDQFLLSLDSSNEVQKIELGVKDKGEVISLSKNDWLMFDQDSWKVGSFVDAKPDTPILRWVQKYGQYLELEGWDQEGSYHRFKWDLFPSSFVKKEELFAQLKIRSEKQISCTIDQQYLILKPGDWALKMDQRWKVLRKKEEKEAFCQGRLVGEMFVLDRIEMKNGTKKAVGRLFSPTRTQVATFESKAQENGPKSRRKLMRRSP